MLRMSIKFCELYRADPYVTSFHMDQEYVYLLAGNSIVKLSIASHKTIHERILFQNEGKSRSLLVDGSFIYVKDFCDLHILKKDTLAPVEKLILGTDLSSDINTLGLDENYLYLSIRNGTMAKIDLKSHFEQDVFAVSDSSIWDFALHGERIYAGNVDGTLLVLDKVRMEVVNKIKASQQNLKSILVTDELLFTASQDKKLVIRDTHTLEIVNVTGNAHKKAFNLIGICSSLVYTICYAAGEIKAWEYPGLTLKGIIGFPGGFGQASIQDKRLYLASRNIKGLVYADLQVSQ